MGMIDIRTPIQMRGVSDLLLKIAKDPLQYVDKLSQQRISIPGDEVVVAAELARQASAAVISNCVLELWSSTVCYLHALEPDFPLYPKSVTRFIKETRLPFMSYVSLYYSLCETPFVGTATENKIKIIVDMRHELQHDKPETSNEYSTERVNKVLKWKARIEPLIGKDALRWQPRVRRSSKKTGFQIQGEPPIMKFMKYPIAKWALESTVNIDEEMHDMLFKYKGRKKIRGELSLEELFDKRFQQDEELSGLWKSGE